MTSKGRRALGEQKPPFDFNAWLERSTAASDVPLKVEDKPTLASMAELLAQVAPVRRRNLRPSKKSRRETHRTARARQGSA
jgi:hypothetical protein